MVNSVNSGNLALTGGDVVEPNAKTCLVVSTIPSVEETSAQGDDDAEPDTDTGVMISARSSVEEITPGMSSPDPIADRRQEAPRITVKELAARVEALYAIGGDSLACGSSQEFSSSQIAGDMHAFREELYTVDESSSDDGGDKLVPIELHGALEVKTRNKKRSGKARDYFRQINAVATSYNTPVDISGIVPRLASTVVPSAPPPPPPVRELPREDREDLFEMPYDDLVALLPLDAADEPTSIGSLDHPGNCVPCEYERNACPRGIYCRRCHMQHGRKKGRSRPCKGQRMRYRKTLEKFKADIMADPESFDFEDVPLPPSIEHDSHRKRRLMYHLQDHLVNVQALKAWEDDPTNADVPIRLCL